MSTIERTQPIQMCEKMDSHTPCEEIDRDIHHFIVAMITTNDKKMVEKAREQTKELVWWFDVFRKRLEILGYDVTEEAELATVFLTESVGTAVQYAIYFAYKARKENIETIDMFAFYRWIGGRKFTKKGLLEAWEMQKKKNGNNSVDDGKLLVSIATDRYQELAKKEADESNSR